ncbi:TPA: hypothetical protein ACUVA9_002077 [Yersinia enterocolitica]
MNNIEERIESLKANVELSKMVTLDELTVSVSDLDALIAQLEAAQKERDVYANLASDVGDIITLLQNNEWAEHIGKTNVGGLLEYQITRLMNSIADINTKLLTAEAALSAANERIDELELQQIKQNDANSVLSAALDAANEKLKGEQVPVEYQYRYHNHGTGCGEWCRVLTKERYEELQREHAGDNDFVFRMLSTAPQKPVALLDKYVRNEKGQYILDGKCEPRIGFAVGWNAAIKKACFTVEGESAPVKYIVILQRAWCNDSGSGINYHSDLVEFDKRDKAIKHGFELQDSDDFNIGVLTNGALTSFDWMAKPLAETKASLAKIASGIGIEGNADAE